MVANPIELDSPISKPISQTAWYRSLSKYEKPDRKKAVGQILNTIVPFVALWVAMAWMIRAGVSYWLTLPLIVVTSGLLIRIFIFFHDCCHGSFFASRTANRIWGYICGTLIFTPYEDWRHKHSAHHATAANLDRRGVGDVWTLTVAEYLAAPLCTRIAYRFFRNPL